MDKKEQGLSLNDFAIFEAFNFPDEVIVKCLLGEEIMNSEYQDLLLLKKVNPFFVERIRDLEYYLTVNGLTNYADYCAYLAKKTRQFVKNAMSARKAEWAYKHHQANTATHRPHVSEANMKKSGHQQIPAGSVYNVEESATALKKLRNKRNSQTITKRH